MSDLVEIKGTCDPRFARVKEIFAESFAAGADLGASVCVYWEGQPVVDLWAGFTDESRTKPWSKDATPRLMVTLSGRKRTCERTTTRSPLGDGSS